MGLMGCADVSGEDASQSAEDGVENTAASSSSLTASQDLTPRTPGKSSVVFSADAVIDADIELVWAILTDLPGYKDWNPWVIEAEGDLTPGGHATVQVKLNGSVQKAEHIVLVVDKPTTFCWKDAGWNAIFQYGQRCRWLTAQADGTVKFHQEVLLDGPLSHIAALFYGKSLQDGINSETAALKATAEAESQP